MTADCKKRLLHLIGGMAGLKRLQARERDVMAKRATEGHEAERVFNQEAARQNAEDAAALEELIGVLIGLPEGAAKTEAGI